MPNDMQDTDMKIVGENPSEFLKKDKELYTDADEYKQAENNGNLKRADKLGMLIAEEYVRAIKDEELPVSNDDNEDLVRQRILLLSFTVMAGLEQYCPNMTLANASRSAFFNKLYEIDRELFEKSSDTGAFSFYYLSFRRGTEVDRRVGQTFAMLCSHDGDPVFQELGEALYCWFVSRIKKNVEAVEFV